MNTANYRIESARPIICRLLPVRGADNHLFSDGTLAVAMAAKSVTVPGGEEIRVVHIPTGEVIFRKSVADGETAEEE